MLTIVPQRDLADDNKGPMLVAVSVSLTLLALVTVLLRAWARLRILNTFGADVS